jgi:hypothetical protein
MTTRQQHITELVRCANGSVAEYQDAALAAVADGHGDLVSIDAGCWAERVIGLRNQLSKVDNERVLEIRRLKTRAQELVRQRDAYRHEAIALHGRGGLYAESIAAVDERVHALLTRRPGETSDDAAEHVSMVCKTRGQEAGGDRS